MKKLLFSKPELVKDLDGRYTYMMHECKNCKRIVDVSYYGLCHKCYAISKTKES
jgi:hypothetical protein